MAEIFLVRKDVSEYRMVAIGLKDFVPLGDGNQSVSIRLKKVAVANDDR